MEKDLYFKDETSKYIFFLVELEGKIQLDFLGVNPSHYSNKEKAKDWYNKNLNIQKLMKQWLHWKNYINGWLNKETNYENPGIYRKKNKSIR